jgi:hypothetical protein
MPQAIPAIATAAKAFFAKTIFTVGTYALTVGTVAKVALAAGAYAYSRAQTKKALRSIGSFNGSRGLSIREPAATRRLVYGKIRMGGTIVFADTSGTNNEFLHLVIAHCEGPCNAIGTVYLNDEVVPLDGSGNATGKYAGFVTVKKHLGGASQTVDTALQAAVGSGVWSNDHRLRGICYSYVRLKHSPDLFPSGLPNYTAEIEGRDDIEDPRDSSTGYSTNAALCLRHYLLLASAMGGLGAAASEVDDDAVQTAANICDEAVNLNPSGTEDRYALNGVIDMANEPGIVIDSMLSAMAGICPYVGGQFKMKAGAHTSSTFSFVEDDITGSVQFATRDSMRDAFNGVKGTYITADNDYQISDFPPIVNATYTTEDGGARIWKDLDLGFTTSSATAQRLAKIELERSRQDIVVTFQTKLGAIDAHVGDVIDVTLARYGWTSKLFEVTDCGFVLADDGEGPTLNLQWTLRETAAEVWDWNSGEETVIDPAPNTDLPDLFTVVTLSGLTVSSAGFTQEDGTLQPRLRAVWDSPVDTYILNGGRTYIEFKPASSATWIVNGGELRGDAVEAFITDVQVDTSVNVRGRHENVRFVRGPYSSTATITVLGDTTAPNQTTGLVATAGAGFVSLAWNASTATDIAEYGVYRNTSNNFGTSVKVAEVSANRFVDAGLTAGTTYYYWITAIDRSENEGTASTVASATPTAPINTSAPATPSAPTFNAEGTYTSGDGTVFAFITVNTPALPSGAVANDILYRVDGGSSWILADQQTGIGTARIDDLSPGVAYQFAIRAVSNGGALSTVSTVLDRTAPNDTAGPAAPTSITYTAGSSASFNRAPQFHAGVMGFGFRVNWVASTAKDVARYQYVLTGTDTDAAATAAAPTQGVETTETEARFSALIWSSSYFRVRSISRTGVAGAWAGGGSDTTAFFTQPAGTITSQNFNAVDLTGGDMADVAIETESTKTGDTAASSVREVRSIYEETVVAALTGGAPTETFNVSLANRGFLFKPDVGNVEVASNNPDIGAHYNFDAGGSSLTNAVIQVFTYDGSNLPAGNVRFSVELIEYP